MVYCFNAELAFSSAVRRDNILSALQTRIAGKARFGVDQLDASVTKIGANGIYAILRFMSRLDQQDIRDRLLAVATGQNAPLPGSWYRLHDCLHDEGGSCGAGVVVTL